jgi:hypothetical protein
MVVPLHQNGKQLEDGISRQFVLSNLFVLEQLVTAGCDQTASKR